MSKSTFVSKAITSGSKSASGEMSTVKAVADLKSKSESGKAPDPQLAAMTKKACGNNGGSCA
jgi:hypothetical protein